MPATTAPLEGRRHGRLPSWPAGLRPVWSRPAAYRAVRATIVIPTLFALTSRAVGDPQMAAFAAFGGFATLVFAAFGGTWRDKLVAHTALAGVGCVLIVIGTAVSGTPALAAVTTAFVAFVVIFSGALGSNAASGATAALVAYVLPASTAAALSTVPSRLEGWLLASAAGTLAVLLLAPRPAGDRVRSATSSAARSLAEELDALLTSAPSADRVAAAGAAAEALAAAFRASPSSAIGLARADRALADLVESVDWCAGLVAGAPEEQGDLVALRGIDRRLLELSAVALRDAASLLSGEDVTPPIAELEQLAAASAAEVVGYCCSGAVVERGVHLSFLARMVAAAARHASIDALIAAGRADESVVAAERLRWEGGVVTPAAPALSAYRAESARGTLPPRVREGLDRLGRVVAGQANLRSVWFLNSARGAVALAAAVAVAEALKLQHSFWVVLGSLSVLRTNAASTGSTAWRAILGTAAGFAVGAALLAAIGGDTVALWVMLPVTVLVGSYAPGTLPFAVGQAAFTVMITLLYNIIAPIGWKVGEVRIEDVGIGVAVSLVAGALFWPRGAGSVVLEDLAESFHLGGLYLVQATAWVLGHRPEPPDAGLAAVRASLRLDDALRTFLAERASRRLAREPVTALVSGAHRLRLTAQSLASVPDPASVADDDGRALLEESVRLAGICDGMSRQLADTSETVAEELAVLLPPEGAFSPARLQAYAFWVRQHLDLIRDELEARREAVAEIHSHRRRSR